MDKLPDFPVGTVFRVDHGALISLFVTVKPVNGRYVECFTVSCTPSGGLYSAHASFLVDLNNGSFKLQPIYIPGNLPVNLDWDAISLDQNRAVNECR